jgi:lipopolysaccharide transport system permease protein
VPEPSSDWDVSIHPSGWWPGLGLRDVWAHRDLLYFLVRRDLTVRYKQTVLGIAWIVLQPLLTMAVFAVFFGRVVSVPSEGIPYPLFAYSGLLPWMFFSRAVTQSTTSLVSSSNLITKVYFPRLVIPTATVLVCLVDLAVMCVVLAPLLVAYGVPVLTWRMLLLAPALGLALLLTLGTSFWLSSLNVKYRDVGSIVNLGLQLGMLATPVIYPFSMVPERWQPWLALNPLVGVTNATRSALFGLPLDATSVEVSVLVSLLLLVSGVVAFRHLETNFADVV